MYKELTRCELMDKVPAAFAEEPHSRMSEEYAFVPTSELIDEIMHQGFIPVSAGSTRVRKPGRKGYEKHLIRFTKREEMEKLEAVRALHSPSEGFIKAGMRPRISEVLLSNSHDGTSNAILDVGIRELACWNGLICATNEGFGFKVKHKGDANAVFDSLLEGIQWATRKVSDMLHYSDQWGKLLLTGDQQRSFAKEALSVKYGDDSPIEPEQLLVPIRGDYNYDLWSTYNLVQEHMMTGGIPGKKGEKRIRTTRGVRGVDAELSINKALWNIAASYAEDAVLV